MTKASILDNYWFNTTLKRVNCCLQNAYIQPGQTLQLTGFWRDHPQFGPQFQVINYQETKPATLKGIEKYLGSGLIKGVGPVTAERIVAHFGIETLEIIENQIERLIEVQGIAKKRITFQQR